MEHNQPNPPKFSFYTLRKQQVRSKMQTFLYVVRGRPHSSCGACVYLLHCIIVVASAAADHWTLANKNVLMQLTSLHNNLIASRRSPRPGNPSRRGFEIHNSHQGFNPRHPAKPIPKQINWHWRLVGGCNYPAGTHWCESECGLAEAELLKCNLSRDLLVVAAQEILGRGRIHGDVSYIINFWLINCSESFVGAHKNAHLSTPGCIKFYCLPSACKISCDSRQFYPCLCSARLCKNALSNLRVRCKYCE